MRLLPCLTCGTHASLASGQPQMFRKGAPKAKLQPYVMGRWTAGRRLTYTCAACRRATVLEVSDWNRLPDLSLDDLRGLGLEWMALDDLRGAGVTDEQLADLRAAGIDPGLDASLLHQTVVTGVSPD